MKWKYITYFCIAISAILLFMPLGAIGAVESEKVKLSTSPTKMLFDASNIKPGDVFERTLIIENDGNVDVRYMMKTAYLSGSKKLFNQFNLKVIDEKTVLYAGSLSDFAGFRKRQLAITDSDELIFQVEFPYESGNEFQGLAVKFQIVISADHVPPWQSGPGDGNVEWFGKKLPKTSIVHPANILLIGVWIALIGIWAYFRKKRHGL